MSALQPIVTIVVAIFFLFASIAQYRLIFQSGANPVKRLYAIAYFLTFLFASLFLIFTIWDDYF
jgi:hypothetical protein